jgi:hypothetical protein
MNISTNITRLISITLISGAITFAILYIFSNKILKKQLRSEKIYAEALLSENMALDKNIFELQSNLSTLKGRNTYLDLSILETSRKLEKKEDELKRLIAGKPHVASMRKKVSELEETRNQLSRELDILREVADQLRTQIESKDNLIATLQIDNKKLEGTNSILNAMIADNYRIEALKGKSERITAVARKTGLLLVSFDLPEDVNENIYFVLTVPGGGEFKSLESNAATLRVYENEHLLIAADNDQTLAFNSKRVEMSFKPGKKLKKGIYRFNVYNNDNYLGSMQLRLK